MNDNLDNTNNNLDDGGITPGQVDPTTEVGFSLHPSWIPNNALDNGSFNFAKFSNPIIPLSALNQAGDSRTVVCPSGVWGSNVLQYSGTDVVPGQPVTVSISAGGTLPTGLAAQTMYWIGGVNLSQKTCWLQQSPGDLAVPITQNTGSGTLTITGVAEAGIVADQLLEDPANNRILMLAHISLDGTPVGASSPVNRMLYLYSAPWGHPEGPWTRLTPYTAPVVVLGGTGAFDSTNVFDGCGFISGKYLYLAYAGTSGSSTENTGKVGLAAVDISQALPVATKLGVAQLGNSPYYGYPAGMQLINGQIVLWVAQARASDGDWMVPSVPRAFYAAVFAIAAANWTPDPKQYINGAQDVGATKHPCLWQQVYLGENRWVRAIPDGPNVCDVSLYLTEMRGEDKLIYTYLANVAQNTPQDTSHYFDSARLFYHLGQWYLTAHSAAITADYEVSLAVYDTTQALPLSNQTQTRTEYPYSFTAALTAPGVNYRTNAKGGTLLDFSVANQVTVTGDTGATNVITGTATPAVTSIDQVIHQSQTGGGLMKYAFISPSNPAQLWLRIFDPETGGAAGPGAELAEGATFSIGAIRLWAKTC